MTTNSKKKTTTSAPATAQTAAPTLSNKPGTVEAFLEVAQKELGYIEGPKDNQTKYGKEFGMNFLPWCGSFVNWCAKQAKVTIPNTISTIAGSNAFKKNKAWTDAAKATPKPGDIAYFNFPGDGIDSISHVGIVLSVKNATTVITLEGNTSPTNRGSQRNGGMVAKKERAFKGKNAPIVGFGRPKFK